MRALRSSIDSPNWGNNLLWLTIAALLNALFIGQIGLFGYGAELIAKRAGLPGKPTVDIDTNRLGDYIEKGIWPFVVHLLVQFALGLIIFIPVGLLVAIFLGIGAAVGGDEFAAFAVVMAVPILAFLAVVAAIGSVPFLIRAMVCQDFQQSFDLSWCLGFVRLMFWEILVSALVYWLLSMCTIILGLLMLCLGYFPAIGMVSGGAMHLVAQWYEVYLSRGGVAVLAAGEQVIDAVEI
ncbi:MAG: hypothetical protein KDB22_28955 [Planctomycetales bacterium]|nr:hypothetical protein [Planctomycetales bacterium]